MAIALMTAAVVAAPSAATGQEPAGDSVVGEGGFLGQGYASIDAHSGPHGEHPTGTLTWHFGGGLAGGYKGNVTCLQVSGRSAVIGYAGTTSDQGVVHEDNGLVRVRDYGDWLDLFEFAHDTVYPFEPPGTPPRAVKPPPRDCSSYPGAFSRVMNEAEPAFLLPAGLVVTNAPLPPAPPPAAPRISVLPPPPLQVALKRGVPLELVCEDACEMRARIYLAAKQARKHRLAAGRKPITVAKGEGRLTKPGYKIVAVRFTKKAKKLLRHATSVTLISKATLRFQGRSRTIRRAITIQA